MSDIEDDAGEADFARFAAEKSAEKAGISLPGNLADDGEPVVPADAPAPAPADAAVPAAKEPPATDIWANASPELIAERDRIQAEADRYKASDFSQRGRLGALQRKLNSYERPAAPAAAEPSQDEPGKDGAPKPKGEAEIAIDAELDRLAEEYPDVASPLVRMLKAHKAELDAIRQEVQPMSDQRDEQYLASQFELLAQRHPDYVEVCNDANFIAWLGDQPTQVQDLSRSTDAREASVVFTLFKSERGAAVEAATPPPPKLDARRQQQLEGSRVVTSRTAPTVEGAPDDMEAAFTYYAKKKAAETAGLRR